MSVGIGSARAAGCAPAAGGSGGARRSPADNTGSACRDPAALADTSPAFRARFQASLTEHMLIAPKLTIQGGTTEILRGVIARGLGLR